MPIAVPPAPGPSDRSANMKANRRRDTSPELAVRSLLHAAGLRFRVDHPIRLEGRRPIRPDIVFTRHRVCVQIHGCWWHGCEDCGRRATRRNNGYWSAKIDRNRERDAEQAAALTDAGWTVLEFWEHDPPEAVARAIAGLVRRRREHD